MYTRLPVWAPSPVPDPLFREVPKAVDTGEIAEIIAGYALVADHCIRGGFDGLELQCSHSSIVRGFLSPATNHRTDGYGGSLIQPGPPAAGNRGGRARDDRPDAGPRRAPLRRRIDRGGHHHRRRSGRGPHGGGDRGGRLHQHVDRRGHRHPVHDRGQHADSARVLDVHPERHPASGRSARHRRGPVQGSAAGRPGPARGALRPGRASFAARSPMPSSRPKPDPATPPTSAAACRATRSAWAAWGSTGGSAASRTRARAGRPNRSRSRPLGPAGG